MDQILTENDDIIISCDQLGIDLRQGKQKESGGTVGLVSPGFP